MKLSTAIDAFLKESVHSKATKTAYASDLGMLLASIKALGDPDSIFSFTADAVTRFITILSAHDRGPATLARKQSAIRSLIAWGRAKSLWAVSATADPEKGLRRIKKPHHLPRPFKKDELARLMLLPLPLVERTIRALLYYTGLRVTPVTELRLDQIDLSPFRVEGVLVAGRIRTIGKGDVEQTVYVAQVLKAQLEEYLLTRPGLKSYDLLFSKPTGARYTRDMLEDMTRRWGRAAGVAKCTPHRFRHSCATDLLAALGDLRLVQEWLGHKDIKTTELYTEVAAVKRARAALVLRTDWRPSVEDTERPQ